MAMKKAAAKKSANKYGPAASKSVEREMKAMEAGTLKSGRSGKKVTNPKQAIAIGLSEARKAGGEDASCAEEGCEEELIRRQSKQQPGA